MNNSVASIRAALLTQLQAVSELQDVQVGRATAFSGFPACRFYLSAIENQLLDNAPSNYRWYRFTIDLYQEMTNKSVADAEKDFQDAVDAVIDRLNSQWTLANNVDEIAVESGTIVEEEHTSGPALRLSLLVSAKTLIS